MLLKPQRKFSSGFFPQSHRKNSLFKKIIASERDILG